MNTTKIIQQIITRALREDAADNDITTKSLIPFGQRSQALILIKEDAVVCGLTVMKKVFQELDPKTRIDSKFRDGARVRRNTVIASVYGKTRTLLTGERTALNFLAYLSGIATRTNRFAMLARHTRTQILDTRKTTPGLRDLDKYAVHCGGGYNHRRDLSEHVLIKDNHRTALHPALSIPEAIKKVRRQTRKKLEIEVDNLLQFDLALKARPDIILLDNMSCAQIRKAVQKTKTLPKQERPLLEASGGITLRNISAVARTGVDRISIGSLTHTHQAIDVSMELVKP